MVVDITKVTHSNRLIPEGKGYIEEIDGNLFRLIPIYLNIKDIKDAKALLKPVKYKKEYFPFDINNATYAEITGQYHLMETKVKKEGDSISEIERKIKSKEIMRGSNLKIVI